MEKLKTQSENRKMLHLTFKGVFSKWQFSQSRGNLVRVQPEIVGFLRCSTWVTKDGGCWGKRGCQIAVLMYVQKIKFKEKHITEHCLSFFTDQMFTDM